MKLLTLTLAAAMVMAATGCETTQQKIAKGYVQDPGGYWVRGDRPYFGDGKPWADPRTVRFDATPFEQARQRAAAPSVQPVIVTGGGGGTTIATQLDGISIVTQTDNRLPFENSHVPRYIDASTQPIYYTENIQQP
jgi:hypothetical protein